MPTIHPADPSFWIQSWFQTALSAISVQILLSEPIQSRLQLVRVASTLVLTTATFSLLHGRNITLQRAVALRLSHNQAEYKTAMANKTILTANGMSTIFRLLLSTVVLSNLPLLYRRLMKGDVAQWADKIDAPVSWFFAAVNLTIIVVCWAMILTEDEMSFEFDAKLDEGQVPLKKLEIQQVKADKDGWKKLASTSRRHDVWVKPVLLPNGDNVGVFDVMTRFASNHPLYNPDLDSKPSGPILRVSLS